MGKVTERIQVSLTEDDKIRLDELKEIYKQVSYSRVVQILIRETIFKNE